MANKDFFDRIADALETLSGDDSHVDEDSPTMDYFKRIAEALEAIVENGGIGSGGTGLPAVTSDDDGDVLTVLNGAWTKAAPFDGVLVVGKDEDDVMDHTWQEIHDATLPIARIGDEEAISWGMLAVFIENGEYFVKIYDPNTENVPQEVWTYKADSASDYPSFYDPESAAPVVG